MKSKIFIMLWIIVVGLGSGYIGAHYAPYFSASPKERYEQAPSDQLEDFYPQGKQTILNGMLIGILATIVSFIMIRLTNRKQKIGCLSQCICFIITLLTYLLHYNHRYG